MKFNSLLTGDKMRVEFPCSSKHDMWAADASSVRLRRRGAPILIESGHGGKWSAATRSISAANCGLTGSNHEIAVYPLSPAPSGSLLTLRQVAARLGVCRRTIEREIAASRFPPPLKIGRCSRVSESDLATYLETLRRKNPGAS
jgi:excisionase family DNA binding protein